MQKKSMECVIRNTEDSQDKNGAKPPVCVHEFKENGDMEMAEKMGSEIQLP